MRQKILLVVASVLAGFLLVETVYRCKLWTDLRKSLARPTYGVLSESLYEFSQPFGYSYAKGKTVLSCEIRDGKVHECQDIRIDDNGNLDSGTPAGTEPVKVLVFGDSFTANPYQPLGWPRYFAEKTGFQVLNFARDGYGLMQMIALAAAKSAELRPDFIIIAFIMDDISRDRIWRSTVKVEGQPTVVVSMDPQRFEDPAAAMEMALIDPAVTPEWCDSFKSGGGPDDALLRRLNGRFRNIAARRQDAYLLCLNRSLLVNFLRYRDPYFGMRVPSRNPLIKPVTFERDTEAISDLQKIRVPLVFIVLPRYEDLAGRQQMGNTQRISLLESLQRMTGIPPVFLLSYMNLENDASVESLFLLPGDNHPSPAGSQAYAEAILRLMKAGAWMDYLGK